MRRLLFSLLFFATLLHAEAELTAEEIYAQELKEIEEAQKKALEGEDHKEPQSEAKPEKKPEPQAEPDAEEETEEEPEPEDEAAEEE